MPSGQVFGELEKPLAEPNLVQPGLTLEDHVFPHLIENMMSKQPPHPRKKTRKGGWQLAL